MSSSTLVETVSLNYEDFSESFLTCSTCLCPYNQGERRPKLLPCSHTVCLNCLQRIANLPQSQDTGSLKCPICRDEIPVPPVGVNSLPPSFLVNQLIDLMQRQRKDVVPKCVSHPAEELLFCETCDTVFCPQCSDPSDVNSTCHNHTIVPFSIAIKRMSEILLYKANQCVKNLNKGAENVQNEMTELDGSVDTILDEVNASFQQLSQLLDKRRQEIIDLVRRTRDDKRRVLQDQLSIIQAEKAKVEQECNGLQYQVEVRSITRKIADLNEKLDATLTLIEPRENAFLKYDTSTGEVMKGIQKALTHFGSLSVSRTFPSLCTASAEPAKTQVESVVIVTTIDYNGHYRSTGGDPVTGRMSEWDQSGYYVPGPEEEGTIPVRTVDNEDGTYFLTYLAPKPGAYRLDIRIFGRPIKNSPLRIDVSKHHNPVWQFGSAGTDLCSLRQPVRVCCGEEGNLFVLDTGNNRVKVLTQDGTFVRHIQGEGLGQQSAVGMALLADDSQRPSVVTGLLTLNWRTKSVTEWAVDGREVKSFTFSEFREPIDLAVDSKRRILVADNGARKVFVFDRDARPVLSFPVKAPTGSRAGGSGSLKSQRPPSTAPRERIISTSGAGGPQSSGKEESSPQHVTCLCTGLGDDVLVGGSELQLYDSAGRFVRSLDVRREGGSGSGPVLVSGIACDTVSGSGRVVASVMDRNRTYLAVSHYKGELCFPIDSQAAKLRRPSGLCVAPDSSHVLVADLGNHCIKKYQFK